MFQNLQAKMTNVLMKENFYSKTYSFDSSIYYSNAMDFLFLFQDRDSKTYKQYIVICYEILVCLFVCLIWGLGTLAISHAHMLALNFTLLRTYLLYAYRGPPREMLHQCHEQITNDPQSSVDSTVQYSTVSTSTMCKTLFGFFTAIKPHLT